MNEIWGVLIILGVGVLEPLAAIEIVMVFAKLAKKAETKKLEGELFVSMIYGLGILALTSAASAAWICANVLGLNIEQFFQLAAFLGFLPFLTFVYIPAMFKLFRLMVVRGSVREGAWRIRYVFSLGAFEIVLERKERSAWLPEHFFSGASTDDLKLLAVSRSQLSNFVSDIRVASYGISEGDLLLLYNQLLQELSNHNLLQ